MLSLLGTFVSPSCNQGEIKGGKNSIEHKLAFTANNGIEVTQLSLPVLVGQVEESILSLVGVFRPTLNTPCQYLDSHLFAPEVKRLSSETFLSSPARVIQDRLALSLTS